jgi:hypothetical protein
LPDDVSGSVALAEALTSSWRGGVLLEDRLRSFFAFFSFFILRSLRSSLRRC